MQAVAHALCERSRALLKTEDKSPTVNPCTRALSYIVEATLATVDTKLLEEVVTEGLQGAAAQRWLKCMGTHLMTDKVHKTLKRVYEEHDIAGRSLRKV